MIERRGSRQEFGGVLFTGTSGLVSIFLCYPANVTTAKHSLLNDVP